jgi:hypothetical protein
MAPGVLFTTLNFRRNFQMSHINKGVTLHLAGKDCQEQALNLNSLFVSYEETEVL